MNSPSSRPLGAHWFPFSFVASVVMAPFPSAGADLTVQQARPPLLPRAAISKRQARHFFAAYGLMASGLTHLRALDGVHLAVGKLMSKGLSAWLFLVDTPTHGAPQAAACS